MDGEGARILSEFGQNRSLAPNSKQAQAQRRLWRRRSRFILDESALKLIKAEIE